MKTLLVLMLLTWEFVAFELIKAQDLEDSPTDTAPTPAQIIPVRLPARRKTSVSFNFLEFSQNEKKNLMFLFDAEIQRNPPLIALTPALVGSNSTDDNNTYPIIGKVLYADPIHLKGSAAYKTFSFSTSFTFAMKAANQPLTGDGLAFVLLSDPGFDGDSNGRFGIFTVGNAPSNTGSSTFAVEFDTFKNPELLDIDSNHVGLDLYSAKSELAASASTLNITMNNGVPITAWIEYSAVSKSIEVRISYGKSKPPAPLLRGSVDLSSILSSQMWVGFSGATSMNVQESHEITSWYFTCDITAEETSVLTKLKNFWKTSGSYPICVAVGAIGILLIVAFISCCCSPCCRRCCPSCKCCERRRPWSSCCPASNCCRENPEASPVIPVSSVNPVPPPCHVSPKEEKEKSCPQAFLERIQGRVSTERNTDSRPPKRLTACLPARNPFSTEQVLQPGCLSSFLFGPDSDDELETRDTVVRPGTVPARGNQMMVSNTVFDMPPEVPRSREPELENRNEETVENCLLGVEDNCLMERATRKLQEWACRPAEQCEIRRRGTEPAARARYDFTPEEQIAMGWGFFSP